MAIDKNLFIHGGNPNAAPNNLANKGLQYVEFYHLPSKLSVAFKAYMKNFQDLFSSQWNAEGVYGRMDPIPTFKRTTRKISFTISILAANKKEAIDNLTGVQAIIQMLYPTYNVSGDDPSTIGGSPLFKILFMNWVLQAEHDHGTAEDSGLLGYLDGFSYVPEMDQAGFFQEGAKLYPKQITADLGFNVVHEHPLGWQESNDSIIARTNKFPYGEKVTDSPSSPTKQTKTSDKVLAAKNREITEPKTKK